ncbi:hypothetical protein MASR2M78_30520 [Treponema sp.]
MDKYKVYCAMHQNLLRIPSSAAYLGFFIPLALQNTSPTLIPLLRKTAFILILHPFLVSLRNQIEGTASYLRKSKAIRVSYGAYLACIAAFGFLSLTMGLGGNLIGSLGLVFANVAAIVSNLLYLKKAVYGFPKINFMDRDTPVYTVR